MRRRSAEGIIHREDRRGRGVSCIFSLFVPALCLITAAVDTVHAMTGQPGGGGGGPQGPAAIFQSFLPLILIFVIFYFLLIRPQSKKAKEHKQMLDSLKKGDKIMTNGGMHGVIEDIDDSSVTVKIGVGSDVKVKIDRSYVAGLRTKE
ncbi:MAG: preprotein translocase subunit YajC [Nitrospiraceae bacterium]|nr:MAG: preprotein translocase subunit YajC [Nitrospiraceae bacterium]